jgi:type III restriction enzyme
MIKLFKFQREASTQISDRFIEYQGNEVSKGTRKAPAWVPFFQSLAALTGAGKTVILADAVAQMSAVTEVAPVILWLSRGRVVVAQTYANLQPSGKYNHILGNANVKLLSEYAPAEVEAAETASLYFATVGTFNRKDMEQGNLTIYKSDIDGTGTSTWDALRERLDADGNRRPLFIVYDEAHNLSEQQTELLLKLQPEAILLASATMQLPPLMAAEIERLRAAGRDDDWLVTKVKSSEVVSEGLVKSALSMAGYKTPMEEAISAMLADMAEAEQDALDYDVEVSPKAIYVCKTNVVADDAFRRDDPAQPFAQRQAPPILIWRYLVEQQGVDPANVAIYANLDTHKDYPLPEELVLFKGGDNDYDQFTSGDFRHIIFNLTLQEGWDDPQAYFAYIDKSMESTVQVTQVIGRVLRQPAATHYPADRLNTAHFYVRVDRNEVFNDILADVAERLGSDLPDVKLMASAPQTARAKQLKPKLKREIPRTATDPTYAVSPVEKLLSQMIDYSGGGANVAGGGSRKIVTQAVGGKAVESEWEDYEEPSRVAARWVFHREVLRLLPRALDVASTADPRFDAQVGVGSPAFNQIKDLANKVVHAFIENVSLVQRKPNPYVVGPILVRESELERFDNALHAGYEGLNGTEKTFARALDKTGLTWARNPSRSGYGIPLISIGDTEHFYPDFVLWTATDVICIDTKAPHILREDAGRKLLSVKPRTDVQQLVIRFVTAGEFNGQFEKLSPDGYTLWGLKDDGKPRAQHFDTLEDLLSMLAPTQPAQA